MRTAVGLSHSVRSEHPDHRAGLHCEVGYTALTCRSTWWVSVAPVVGSWSNTLPVVMSTNSRRRTFGSQTAPSRALLQHPSLVLRVVTLPLASDILLDK
jgi:hypothetical protein